MRTGIVESWAVYQRPVKNCPDGMRAVCEQSEWDAMERARPGVNTLIQANIANEGVAERLARGASGATVRRNPRLPLASLPDKVATVLGRIEGPSAA